MKDLDHLKLPRAGETSSRFTKEQALAAQKFHQTLPGYSVTRLVELPALAKELGVKDIFVKDEASRFGLNSFKGLGGSYCLFHPYFSESRWNKPPGRHPHVGSDPFHRFLFLFSGSGKHCPDPHGRLQERPGL